MSSIRCLAILVLVTGPCLATNASGSEQPVSNWTPRSPPIVDIFIRTCREDGHWLSFLIRSIEAHVPDDMYRHIIITFNEVDADYFASWLPSVDLPLRLVPVRDVYIKRTHSKASAMLDRFYAFTASDADYFIHLDSKSIITRPVSLLDFIDDTGRVYADTLNYTSLPPVARHTKPAVEAMFLETATEETVTGQPIVYPRDLYPAAVKYVEARHNQTFTRVCRCLDDMVDHSALGHYLVTHMAGRWTRRQNKCGCLDHAGMHGLMQLQFPGLYTANPGEGVVVPGGLTPDIAAAFESKIRA